MNKRLEEHILAKKNDMSKKMYLIEEFKNSTDKGEFLRKHQTLFAHDFVSIKLLPNLTSTQTITLANGGPQQNWSSTLNLFQSDPFIITMQITVPSGPTIAGGLAQW
jgi:hypothetical protein